MNEQVAGTDEGGGKQESALLAYGISANVRREIGRGEGGLDIQRGTKHFTAGAKVWVLPVHWGDGGEQVVVVGRHRGSRGPYIKMVTSRRCLENFRVRRIYSPALMAAMERPLRNYRWKVVLWPDEETAVRTAEAWNHPRIKAYFDRQHYKSVGVVCDPPPAQVVRGGTTFQRPPGLVLLRTTAERAVRRAAVGATPGDCCRAMNTRA